MSKSQLKVASAVFSNLAVVWMVAFLGSRDVFALTGNSIYVILSLYIAVEIEKRLEEYD